MAWGLGKKDKNGKPAEAKAEPAAKTAPLNTAADAPAAKDDKSDAARQLAMAEMVRKAQFSQNFAQAVGVLMRDARYGNLPIKDLQVLLVPAVVAGQTAIGFTKSDDKQPAIPVALALWARVSDALDKRFSEQLDQPMTLRQNEWQSGDNVWIITLAGQQSQLTGFLKELVDREFKGKTVKLAVTGKDGKRTVKALTGGKTA